VIRFSNSAISPVEHTTVRRCVRPQYLLFDVYLSGDPAIGFSWTPSVERSTEVRAF